MTDRTLRIVTFAVGLVTALVFMGQRGNSFSTRAQQEYAAALTTGGIFGVPRYTTVLLPTCSTVQKGALAYDTTASALSVCSGTAWAAAGGASGTGTTNALTKFTTGSTGAIGDSRVTDDGTTVTISSASIIDNGAAAAAIAIFKDNGTAQWTIADGGDLLPKDGTASFGSATVHVLAGWFGTATDAQYIKLTHDGTDGVITSGSGSVSIPSSNGNSLRIGSGAGATADGATALGWHASGGGVHAVAVGDGAAADGITAIAIGGAAGSNFTASQSYGYSAVATAAHQATFGCDACTYGEVDQFRVIGTAPTVTAGCGTSPSLVGSATAGKLNVGTGGVAANCTLTFPTAFTSAPACVANDETTGMLVRATSTTTTVLFTVAVAFTASDIISYQCIAGK